MLLKRVARLVLCLALFASICFGAGRQIDFLAAGLTDTDGNPLTGGLVHTYAAGTSTDKSTYTTPAKAVAHPNPIVLDTYGRVLAFGDGRYKFKIYNASNTLLYEWDGMSYQDTSLSNSATVIQTSTAGQTTIDLGAGYSTALDTPYLYLGGIKQARDTYTWAPPIITLEAAIPVAGITIEVGF